MQQPKQLTVTVIVPVFNASRYLVQCIESIRKQTYPPLEIVCVDDGSTDNSLRILEYMRSLDSRVIVIHQANKGQSAARNEGLRHARGDLISFVDSDDVIDLKFLEKSVRKIEETGAEICFSNMEMFDDKGYVSDRCYSSIYYKKVVGRTYDSEIGAVMTTVPIGIYSSRLFDGNSQFLEGVIFEDWIFMTKLLNHKNIKYCMIDECLYKYRRGIVSTTSRIGMKTLDFFFFYSLSREGLKKNPRSGSIEHLNDRAFVESAIGYYLSKVINGDKNIRVAFLKRLGDELRLFPESYLLFITNNVSDVWRDIAFRCRKLNDDVETERLDEYLNKIKMANARKRKILECIKKIYKVLRKIRPSKDKMKRLLISRLS